MCSNNVHRWSCPPRIMWDTISRDLETGKFHQWPLTGAGALFFFTLCVKMGHFPHSSPRQFFLSNENPFFQNSKPRPNTRRSWSKQPSKSPTKTAIPSTSNRSKRWLISNENNCRINNVFLQNGSGSWSLWGRRKRQWKRNGNNIKYKELQIDATRIDTNISDPSPRGVSGQGVFVSVCPVSV